MGVVTSCLESECSRGYMQYVQDLFKAKQAITQKEFEETMDFLGKVPLFKLQLPRADRPRVALAFRRTKYSDGDIILQQATEDAAFLVIMSGTASVCINLDGKALETAQLSAGDHFGGATLAENDSNRVTVTILAKGPVEILRMTREDFERLRLHGKVKFHYKPAIYEGKKMKLNHATAMKTKASKESSPQINEFVKLLEEVPMFHQLLAADRYELAHGAIGIETFEPGQMLLSKGARPLPHLYIIERGTCTVSKSGKELVRLGRAGCFGERAILQDETVAEEDIQAGLEGMACLTVAGELLKNLPMCFDGRDVDKGVPDVRVPLHAYYDYVAHCDALTRAAKGCNLLDLKLNNFVRGAKLGSGGFGEVFLAMHRDGQQYALKKMSKANISRRRAHRQIVSERDTLINCDSSFIVKLYQTFTDEEFVYMLLEAVQGGELYQLLANHPAVVLEDEPLGSAALFYVACMAEAIGHMHERSIAYRDLKLENALLDNRGYVKLCDMGFAKFVTEKTYTMLGTPQYLAPEMIDDPHAHDIRVDWWALGVVAFELLTLQGPWDNERLDDNDVEEELAAIRRSHNIGPDLTVIPAELSRARDFVRRLLCPCPKKRLGSRRDVQEIREHAWPTGADFNWDALARRGLRAPWRAKRGMKGSDKTGLRSKQSSFTASTVSGPPSPRTHTSMESKEFSVQSGEESLADDFWSASSFTDLVAPPL